MQVPVILAWSTMQVKVQRRPAASQNALGEPNYGDESTWPVVNDPYGNTTHAVRIEFDVEDMQFTPTGERIAQKTTLMFIDPYDLLLPEDRITIITSDINPTLPSYFIIYTVWPEYDAVGDVNHYVATLQVH